MGLAEQPVPRSYHLQDNDWTPLSQNLCWKATIYLLSVFTRSDRPRPNTKFSRLSGTESVKSFVDDFDMERGIVRVRVGLSYDPLRLSPCSGDLYEPPQKSAGSFKKACLAPPQLNIHNPKQIITTPVITPNFSPSLYTQVFPAADLEEIQEKVWKVWFWLDDKSWVKVSRETIPR